jgi:hypothetical protein
MKPLSAETLPSYLLGHRDLSELVCRCSDRDVEYNTHSSPTHQDREREIKREKQRETESEKEIFIERKRLRERDTHINAGTRLCVPHKMLWSFHFSEFTCFLLSIKITYIHIVYAHSVMYLLNTHELTAGDT